MPFPPHFLLAYGGSASGGEEWSCTVRLAGPSNGFGDLPEADLLPPAAVDVSTFVNDSTYKLPNTHKLEWVKLNKIGPDGRYLDPTSSHTHFYPTPPNGLYTCVHPHQVALVVGTMTEAERGFGSRGRFYLPGGAYAVTLDAVLGPVISDADRDAVASAAASFMAALSSWPAGAADLRPHVMSSRGTLGAVRPITRVRVGRRLDVQRRRAGAQGEAYEEVPVGG